MESDLSTLLELCWLVEKQRKAEIAYIKAQWQVSYYKKIKVKLDNHEVVDNWDKAKIAKKLNAVKLASLKRQKQLLDTRKRLRQPLSTVGKKLKAKLVFVRGKITEIMIPLDKHPTCRWIKESEIAEMSDQYEAERALNKVLTR